MPDRSRILLDAVEVGPNGKGIERVLVNIVPRLVAKRPEVYVCATTGAGVPLLDLPTRSVTLVPQLPDTVWEQVGLPLTAARVGAAAVYTHREAGPLWGARCLLHVPEDPEIRWARSPAAGTKDRLRRSYSRRLMRASLRRATVSTSTAAVWDDLATRSLVTGSPRVTPLGVDLDVFRPFPGAERVMFHLGSRDPRDNLGAVTEAFEQVAAVDRDAELVVAGNLGAQREQVAAWAADRGWGQRVRLPGRVSDRELAQLLGTCRVAVAPSLDEGFGLQALEAIACGAPLVVAPGPSVSEVVGDAAEVSADQSGPAVAERVVALWHDAGRRAQLAEAGPARASEFSWDAAADRLDDMLMGLRLS